MEKIKSYLQLIRVRQWYKNLIIFLPLFFSGHLFFMGDIYLTVMGFISLCFLSSFSYILNDLIDLKKDLHHPEKKNRPLVSGAVSKVSALILTIILLILSLGLGLLINNLFLLVLIVFLILAQIYTFWLKKVVFADILTISSLFVMRAIAGAIAIEVKISPWLVLCPFFLALFLAVGKRHSDLLFLKEKAVNTRIVLQEYTSELTNYLMIISTTLLVISYSLYCFLSEHQYLLFTLPFALFVIFRFFYLIQQGSELGRSQEKAIKDRALVIGMILWLIITTIIIYFPLTQLIT